MCCSPWGCKGSDTTWQLNDCVISVHFSRGCTNAKDSDLSKEDRVVTQDSNPQVLENKEDRVVTRTGFQPSGVGELSPAALGMLAAA